MVGIKRDSVQMRKAAKKIGQGKKGKERFHEIDDEEDRVVPPLKLVRFRCPTLIHSSFVRKLEKLENKKACVREEGLSAFIKIFLEGFEDSILENYFITYLEQMLNCLKKGLTKEKQLASQALGLMAISVCETENADEVYRYTISQVTKLLRVPDKLLEPCGFIALVECLAIVTSFCASNSVEIQEAMQVIWEYICPKSKALKNQVSATTLSTLIYAWMFLLTRVYRLEIISGRWQGVISRFLTLLKEDATCVAAGEALALIFERDKVDRFFVKTEELLSESYDGLRKYIKNIILKQLESTSMEAKTAPPLKQMFNNAARTDWDVLMYFKEDKRPKYCEIFDGQKLILTSWTSITQFNFLKNFVGEEEFSYYLMENEVIQELFAFVPYYEEEETPCLYEPIEEKIEAKVYLPGTRGKDPELLTRSQIKKEREQTKSIIDKSRTKLMNKRRTFAEERKGKGYFEEVESTASLFGLLF